ncbi:MAG: hydroxyacid dehydrogenase [Gemmatimonadota bacterium]|nr:hydroxyacid dehydrogenase [Gemmatimonadota bacterium]
MKPDILVLIKEDFREEFLPDLMVDRIEKIGQVEIAVDPQDYPVEKYAGLFAGKDAVITSWNIPPFGPEVLEQADKLKIISHAAGQVRFFLSSDIFQQRPDLLICNASNVMSRAVAEHTLCVTLACLRNLFVLRQWVTGSENWWDYGRSLNRSLLEKKVGIIGLGQIGRDFIDLVRPFDVELLVYSKHLTPEAAAEQGLKKCELEEIFTTCDVITLSAADTKENRHLVSRSLLEKIKPGAVFVNNARGAIVDEQALVDELETGRFMAALDVTDPEPPAAESKLRSLDNVLLTPHIGGPVPEQWYWMMREAVRNLERFFAGEPVNCVITQERYRYMA